MKPVVKAAVRKASPPRPEQEQTFQAKLAEVKRMREAGILGGRGGSGGQTPGGKRLIINGKPAERVLGDWAEMKSSRGKSYYFNMKSQVSTWIAPAEFQVEPRVPPLPNVTQSLRPALPAPVEPQRVEREATPPPPRPVEKPAPPLVKKKTSGFKMKIKGGVTKKKGKVKKKNGKRVNNGAGSSVFEGNSDSEEDQSPAQSKTFDLNERDGGKYSPSSPSNNSPTSRSKSRSRSRSRSRSKSRSRSPSRSRRRSRSRSRSRSRRKGKARSRSRSRSRSRHQSRSRSPKKNVPSLQALPSKIPFVNAAPVPAPDLNMKAVLEAKAKIESQMKSHNSLISFLDHKPSHQVVNPTWMTEYNFPATLSRCMFPKISDVLHEMQTNRGKKRSTTLAPIPAAIKEQAAGLVSEDDLRKDMFLLELKDPNNRHRLLTEKLGQTVYKIPDELWERSFSVFQIDLMQGVRLETKPHGFTEDNVPVYTRTGKVCKSIPYPEDIVRCHAVLQVWKTERCHVVYANKTYLIERDDTQWKKDLEDCRKFLRENGY